MMVSKAGSSGLAVASRRAILAGFSCHLLTELS